MLKARNVTHFDYEAYWVTIPQKKAEETDNFDAINNRKECCLTQIVAVRYAYLVKVDVFPDEKYLEMFERRRNLTVDPLDPNGYTDAIFSSTLANLSIPIHLMNDKTYGQLVNIKGFPWEKLHPELVRIMENHDLWESRYIQEQIIKSSSKSPDEMPEILPKDTVKPGNCRDTYHFPLFTEMYTQQWIEEAEFVDNWFKSGNDQVYDDRNGRPEPVPTTDINLWQYGMEQSWLATIDYYLYPRKCVGYPAHTGLDVGGHFFTVRYRWEEQAALKPHHDNSLYSINLALNQIGVDFEGGGTRFLRFNCSELNMDVGTIMAHPGKVTHFHEGRHTTSGTRYILVGFVNANYALIERRSKALLPGKEVIDEDERQHFIKTSRTDDCYPKTNSI